MKLIIKLFGVLMLVAGISLLIYPEFIIGWMEDNMESTPLYISAIIVRLVIGVLFIAAARESKYPVAIKFFGYLFILISITFIFIGQESFQHLITSLLPDVEPYAPLSGLLSMAFGGFIIYAFSTNRELERK
ncbi:hypothetical protein OO009_12585 [Flavobacteriaceae bacterium KMM 6897]|nr:hypothetical protein [Flavobacteriaceae bacterium KMM 6897]